MAKSLNPIQDKNNLLACSLFLTGYETLKSSIQDNVMQFLNTESFIGKDGNLKYRHSEIYVKEILNRIIPEIDKNKYKEYHLFYSSCLWLIENNIINIEDYTIIEELRFFRNEIAHNPLNTIIDKEFDFENINKCRLILSKIEKKCFLKFEAPLHSEYDNLNIEEKDVKTGRMIILDYLNEIAQIDFKTSSSN